MQYVASLPWYDLREARESTDGFWEILRRHIVELGVEDVPESLERTRDYSCQWGSPSFLFGQACGYDALLAYRDHLQVVATPHYDAAGCDGANHSSYVVVREDSPFDSIPDLRGRRCTFNTNTSHSGRNALRRVVAPHHGDGRFFSAITESGSHEESLTRIQTGTSDVAAVDCVTHALLQRHRPGNLSGTRIIMQTAPVPAPPYVTSVRTPRVIVDALRDALAAALDELDDMASDLLLEGVEILPLDAYEPIAEMERRALALGYRELDAVAS